MPNKEHEPSNEPVGSLLASDPRYFEINLIQQGIIDAAQALLAKESALTHPSDELQRFVAGMRTDSTQTPKPELLKYLSGLKARQVALLKMDPNDYTPTPDIQLLQDIVSGATYVEGSEVVVDICKSATNPQSTETMALVKVEEVGGETYEEGAWPTGRSEAEWDRLFVQSAFFAEDNWVAALFAKELVFRPFGESNV